MHELTGRTHWHEPTGNRRRASAQFGRPKTPYDVFMERKAFRSSATSASARCRTCRSQPWKRMGGKGSYIQLLRHRGQMGLLRGRGAGRRRAQRREAHVRGNLPAWSKAAARTEVWLEGDSKKHVFEWQKGSMFSIPDERHAPHRQRDAPRRALLLAGTTAPNVMNLINNVDAVFNNPFVFRDRFSGADDFFKHEGRHRARSGARARHAAHQLHPRRRQLRPAARQPPLARLAPRRAVHDQQQFYFWIGQHENGRYSKAHAHTSAAVLICLKGKGYTYTWPEQLGVTPWKDGQARPGQARRLRAGRHGHRGARRRALVPPAFRRSKDPLRLTAWFGPHNPGREPGAPGEKHTDYTGDRHPRGRHRHPVLDGGSVSSARNTRRS